MGIMKHKKTIVVKGTKPSQETYDMSIQSGPYKLELWCIWNTAESVHGQFQNLQGHNGLNHYPRPITPEVFNLLLSPLIMNKGDHKLQCPGILSHILWTMDAIHSIPSPLSTQICCLFLNLWYTGWWEEHLTIQTLCHGATTFPNILTKRMMLILSPLATHSRHRASFGSLSLPLVLLAERI